MDSACLISIEMICLSHLGLFLVCIKVFSMRLSLAATLIGEITTREKARTKCHNHLHSINTYRAFENLTNPRIAI